MRGPVPHGSLSLPARLALLSRDGDGAEIPGTAQVVRAGALVELAVRGLLVDEDGIATPADMDSDSGDPVLDGLLELVRESGPHGWRTWVTLHSRVTRDVVREQLAAAGYLRGRRKWTLGIFPSVAYESAAPGEAAALRLRQDVRGILDGRVPAEEVSERDVATTVLAAAAGLSALSPSDGPEDMARVEDLIERGGEVAPVLREVAHEVRATVGGRASAAAGTMPR
ncbi:GPP34 family phosphoprotein [Streptomyces sp. NPDC047072]|uniref:GOLPH3/VPS74 family protein n=1 Tax=Streptomyces sp. NPDC047072 TaxID=3154809 RepID=UPI0033F86939